MADAAAAIAAAAVRGIDSQQVLELAEYFAAHRTRWHGVGALHYRLTRGTDWPQPSPQFLRDQQRQAADVAIATRQQTVAEQRAQAERERAELAALEAAHAAELAALSRGEFATLCDQAIASPGVRAWVRQHNFPHGGAARRDLLLFLQQRKATNV